MTQLRIEGLHIGQEVEAWDQDYGRWKLGKITKLAKAFGPSKVQVSGYNCYLNDVRLPGTGTEDVAWRDKGLEFVVGEQVEWGFDILAGWQPGTLGRDPGGKVTIYFKSADGEPFPGERSIHPSRVILRKKKSNPGDRLGIDFFNGDTIEYRPVTGDSTRWWPGVADVLGVTVIFCDKEATVPWANVAEVRKPLAFKPVPVDPLRTSPEDTHRMQKAVFRNGEGREFYEGEEVEYLNLSTMPATWEPGTVDQMDGGDSPLVRIKLPTGKFTGKHPREVRKKQPAPKVVFRNDQGEEFYEGEEVEMPGIYGPFTFVMRADGNVAVKDDPKKGSFGSDPRAAHATPRKKHNAGYETELRGDKPDDVGYADYRTVAPGVQAVGEPDAVYPLDSPEGQEAMRTTGRTVSGAAQNVCEACGTWHLGPACPKCEDASIERMKAGKAVLDRLSPPLMEWPHLNSWAEWMDQFRKLPAGSQVEQIRSVLGKEGFGWFKRIILVGIVDDILADAIAAKGGK